MKLVWKKLIQIFAYWFALGFATYLGDMWFLAFFNGMRVTITINDYGEAYPELFMWTLLIPILTFGFYMSLTDLKQLMNDAKKYKVKVGNNDIPT